MLSHCTLGNQADILIGACLDYFYYFIASEDVLVYKWGLIYHSPAHLEGFFVKKLLKTSCHHIFPGCTDHEQLPVSRHRAGKKNSSERIISVWTLFGPCPCEKSGNWFLFFFRKEMESADTEWARALRAGGGEAAAQAHAGQRNIQIKMNIC